MSLSITRLATHWDADEAYTVMVFLDELREQLWQSHGDAVTAMLRDATSHHDDRQLELPFESTPPF